jgi:hypothetical protein
MTAITTSVKIADEISRQDSALENYGPTQRFHKHIAYTVVTQLKISYQHKDYIL